MKRCLDMSKCPSYANPADLEELGIQEGDTVRMYGLSFDYYK